MSQVRERHARFYLDDCRARPGDWVWFETEWPQIQRAWLWVSAARQEDELLIAYVRAVLPFQAQRDLWHEVVVWAERALPIVRARAAQADELFMLAHLARARYELGQVRRALDLHGQCLTLALTLADPAAACAAWGGQASASLHLGEARQARDYFQQQLALARAHGLRAAEASALRGLGAAHFDLGEFGAAGPVYAESLALYEALGDQRNAGAVFGNMGNARAVLGLSLIHI
mgnify:FL=1